MVNSLTFNFRASSRHSEITPIGLLLGLDIIAQFVKFMYE